MHKLRSLDWMRGQMSRWKLATLFIVVVVALSGAAIAHSLSGPNAQLLTQDRLYGGGGTDPGCFVPDISFCRTTFINFAIDAHATGTGQAAYGDYVYGPPTGPTHVQITCLAVDGVNAAVGGVIVASTNAAFVGDRTVTFFVDNGTDFFGGDFVSPNYTFLPSETTGLPAGFPYVCPSPDTGAPAAGVVRSFLPISRGDIVIQDAS
jgi:hypothetical protein